MSVYEIIITVLCVLILIITAIFVITDRERRRLISQKDDAYAEVERTNTLLLDAVRAANEANHAKSDFLSHMTHDIRTPINGIMGMTSIGLKNIGSPERVTDCFKKIDASSRHLLSLVNDILDMSRIESGKEHINRRPLSVSELLNHVSSIICGQIVDRNIDFVTEFRIEHANVIGDDLHIRQILLNILGNAVKFTPDGGRIIFSAEEADRDPDGKWILYKFVITDTGIGMAQDFVGRIFDPFVQAENSVRTSYQGTGLGLTITKKFVDLLDGTISVRSVLGKGTSFTVMLPIDVNDDEIMITKDDRSFGELIRGMNVLIAEDNELNAEILICMLEEVGVTSRLAANGQEAVDIFRESQTGTFDMILMDIMMPLKDGFEASREIRALMREDAADIPIIAVTANTYEGDIKDANNAGMDALIGKPVSPQSLFKIMYNYSSRRTSEKNRKGVSGLNILLAEDNDLNAEIAAELLAEHGITVKRAVNGLEAFAYFKENPVGTFDAILMDICMPVMDGLKASSVIRGYHRQDAAKIPIIAMTANSLDDDSESVKAAGINSSLQKPLEIGKLLETLKIYM